MERKPCKDCFFGVHFDFHAGKDCTNIGEHTTPEMIRHMLHTVRPDFVQCDCKGHPGIASYPTEVGTAAPGFKKDNLRIWRDVTAQAGIPLILHYSGVFDMAAAKAHPDWAIVDGEGNTSGDYTSLKGGYCDGLLIPQLCEVAEKYDVDGAWIDGEAWAVKPDYSPAFLEAFRRDTGCETVPHTPEDAGYEEYMNYLRESFLAYLRHYTREIHKKHPHFRIASNWAFSTYQPEKVSADVDFLSADYSPIDSYNTARFEARYLACQGLPWNIMGWSFIISPEEFMPSTKSSCQISREASVPLSLGGGFQVYIQQKRDGSLEEWMLPVIGEVSDFCNARKAYCFQSENVPQVAVLLSACNYYKVARRPLHPDQEHLAVRGITQALLDNQLSVQIISEHHLEADLMKYPVLVVPETGFLAPETVTMLRDYMRRGGHLIAVGPLAAQYFPEDAGVAVTPYSPDVRKRLADCLTAEQWNRAAESLRLDPVCYLSYNGWMTGLNAMHCKATPLENTLVIGKLFKGNSPSGDGVPGATYRKVGEGSCTCVWVNLGEKYLLAQRFLVRDFLGDLVNKSFIPMVRVQDTHFVDVNITRKNGDLLVHFINTSGSHGSPYTLIYDEVTPLAHLRFEVDCPQKPKAIEAVPPAPLKWEWRDGTVYGELEKLEIYTILSIEEEDRNEKTASDL